MEYNLYNGNCLDVMKTMEDNSVDSIVTDPPYGLSFMNKHWDYDVPKVEIWKEALRVLKPGGHLLAFAGTRTQHRMCVNIEDAGFEIRDMIAWVYGSGFPKSLNISKAIDKKFGAEREIVSEHTKSGIIKSGKLHSGSTKVGDVTTIKVTKSNTDLAKKWEGWGTGLKPAFEPITLARKPIEEKTITDNVLKYDTGAINIDSGRILMEKDDFEFYKKQRENFIKSDAKHNYQKYGVNSFNKSVTTGRFPSNLIHDGSEEVEQIFPETTTGSLNSGYKASSENIFKYDSSNFSQKSHTGSIGSASRFFYCAKTSKRDRGENNNHPTVKPTKLMRYLVKLITPKDGICLDPFMGSGSTGKACKLENFNFIGIDMESDYIDIAKERIEGVKVEPKLF